MYQYNIIWLRGLYTVWRENLAAIKFGEKQKRLCNKLGDFEIWRFASPRPFLWCIRYTSLGLADV